MQELQGSDGSQAPETEIDAGTVAGGAGTLAAPQLWQATLGQLQLQVTRPIFETYLRETAGVRFDGETLAVAAPSDFATEWLSIKLRPLILQTLSQIVGGPATVTFEVIGAPGRSAQVMDGAPLLQPRDEPDPSRQRRRRSGRRRRIHLARERSRRNGQQD